MDLCNFWHRYPRHQKDSTEIYLTAWNIFGIFWWQGSWVSSTSVEQFFYKMDNLLLLLLIIGLNYLIKALKDFDHHLKFFMLNLSLSIYYFGAIFFISSHNIMSYTLLH